MRLRTRVVGVVDNAGDAGIEAADRGGEIADVHVLRLVERRKPAVGGAHVVADGCTVGNDAAKLSFPGVAMAIDHARDDDPVSGLDDNRIAAGGGRAQVRRDGGDLFSFDQNIATHEVADRCVHRDDGRALEKNAAG